MFVSSSLDQHAQDVSNYMQVRDLTTSKLSGWKLSPHTIHHKNGIEGSLLRWLNLPVSLWVWGCFHCHFILLRTISPPRCVITKHGPPQYHVQSRQHGDQPTWNCLKVTSWISSSSWPNHSMTFNRQIRPGEKSRVVLVVVVIHIFIFPIEDGNKELIHISCMTFLRACVAGQDEATSVSTFSPHLLCSTVSSSPCLCTHGPRSTWVVKLHVCAWFRG